MADTLEYKKIEEVTPEDLLAEYEAAGEDYAVQNKVEGK